MKEGREIAHKMLGEIWAIFNEYGGYDYNDEMYWQTQGAEDSWNEASYDNDWESLISEYTPCLEYMRHIKKIRILQEDSPQETSKIEALQDAIPQAIYG
tara:strand:- start:293 stop:589 length:297 start_codon:yes stop_codon:yes gene_type:complete